ncbi:M17 family peptidase N-terminal domain-containing protein [Chryseobacterium daecheongense]|uniref:Cytosol aminopeptidase family protein n=1 Tax=Chryseobacterium daecheongense TaxID=192389 RepID=A0A3N0W5C5_9FLAO|nr:M17 family peptidase N-terminal domain-containing protein [Chryseobacterium daecheongense]ROI00258.1 peptidase M17 [Chryseobacterium daecheongense]TDX94783.1 cytosol aminopeptidase family protein [Chryseobacterium daecheongense]
MQNSISKYFNWSKAMFTALILTASSTGFVSAQTTEIKTAVGTTTTWGTVDGVSVVGLVQGPSAAAADLQIACVFEYTEGDIFNPPALPAELNGMVHLDEALKGIITDVRKSGKFKGHALETLLIAPPKGSLASKKLLLIGLGNRSSFDAELMKEVGSVAMREALKLKVKTVSFASDIKDAGIDSPTALVAENVVLGAFDAYRAQAYLDKNHLSEKMTVQKLILLAGPSFFNIAGGGIKSAIAKLNTQ